MSLGSFLGAASDLLSGSYGKDKTRQSTSTTTKNWSDEVQRRVEDQFLDSLGYLDYGQNAELGDALSELAYNSGIDVEPIINEARRQATMESGQTYQRLAREAGSSANSLVNAAYNEAVLAREDNLAALRAELEAQNQSSQLDALAQALDARNQANTAILNLGQLLQGGQQTQTSVGRLNNTKWNIGYSAQSQKQGQVGA